ncbi:hypothetical protein [Halodesulfurarchaeum sp.]|uniref:hypothetical protein n=1 Tax=Halodesulfurarchaeum sp. TaxID=1980530 RepID=UPI002FC337B2
MPTRESTGTRRLFRTGSAVALLLAGTTVLAVGGAGFLTEILVRVGTPLKSAQSIAVGIGALVPPIVFIGATWTTTGNRRAKRLAVGGGLLAGGTVVLSFLTGGLQPASVSFDGLLGTTLFLGYGSAIVVVFAALLDGITTPKSNRSGTRTEQGWQSRSRTPARDSTRSGPVPADGGSEDSDLAFPLDSDGGEDPEDADR